MKKTLIALAALGAAVSVHATNVTVYGVADIGYKDVSGKDVAMAEKVNSRLGVKGSEDLGNGLKAIFKLEQRMELMDGSSSSTEDFEGAAWVGLQGDFGKVTFGHLNQLSTETLRKLDPFNQYGVGSMLKSSLRNSGRLDRSVRWDAPAMSGVQLGLTYTIDAADANGQTGDAGFGISATYTNGAIYAIANYDETAGNLGDSWNIGGSYDFGAPKVSIAYESTDNTGSTDTVDKWLVGLSYAVESGTIMASYNTSDDGSVDVDKWALGYTHNLSKRTSAYADIANLDVDGESDVTSINVGITHKF